MTITLRNTKGAPLTHVEEDENFTDLDVRTSYGWRDMVSELITRGGASAPSLAQFRNGVYLYSFPANAPAKEVFANFHIDHDYKRGTAIYPHMHWSPSTTGTGTVRWAFEYTFAKGHQQASGSVFPETVTVYAEQTISEASQYKHFIAEVGDADAIPGADIEVDGVILMRIYRDVASDADTYPGAVFGFFVDCHYQADRMATKNKAPNFYA